MVLMDAVVTGTILLITTKEPELWKMHVSLHRYGLEYHPERLPLFVILAAFSRPPVEILRIRLPR